MLKDHVYWPYHWFYPTAINRYVVAAGRVWPDGDEPHSPLYDPYVARSKSSVSFLFIQVRAHIILVYALLIGLLDPGGIPTDVELS